MLFAQTVDVIREVIEPDFTPPGLFWLLTFGVALPYLALRARDTRADLQDPDLGIKVVYHFFLSVGIILALFGTASKAIEFLAWAAERPYASDRLWVLGKWAESLGHRSLAGGLMPEGWATVATGLSVACGSAALIYFTTNVRSWPAVRRMFAGWRLAAVGLVLVVALFDLNHIAVRFIRDAEPPRYGSLEVTLALLGVFGSAFGFHVWLMKRYSRLPYYTGPAGE